MTSTQTGSILRRIRTRLEPVAGDTALYEAEYLLTHILLIDRSRLYLEQSRSLTASQLAAVDRAVQKRLTGMPLAYVLGVAYFHSREFTVSPAVLIPRPETEVLVEKVLEEEPTAPRLFLDMGIGSGAVAETLVASRHRWRAVGVDVSAEAINVARRNCSAAVRLVRMDRLEGLRPATFDFTVSNPPYVSAAEMNRLDRGVADFEPVSALYGGDDGLDFYRYLARHARRLLKNDGRLYCEIGDGQADAIQTIFQRKGWGSVTITPDLAGRDRVVRVRA
jgi:release factor glutamine methyltransferase